VDVQPVPLEELIGKQTEAKPSSVIRDRVMAARRIQWERFRGKEHVHCNAQMSDEDIMRYCPVEEHERRFLWHKMQELQLSARSYMRILKIARTIADLDGAEEIEIRHIAEAVQLRSLDKPIVTPKTKTIALKKDPFAVQESCSHFNGNGHL
jgi:magnesium chelatase family protein